MIKLTNWCFSKRITENKKKVFIAEGIVSNHPKLVDGIYIHTSIIEKLEMDTENNRFIMHTHSKNLYELLFADINMQEFKNIQKCFKHFHISGISLQEYQKLKEDKEKQMMTAVTQILQENELYLRFNGAYAQKAFFKNAAGEVREIRIKPHIGMFKDSYLVSDWEKGEVDFRYFDGYNLIKPYHWNDGLLALMIENTGSEDIEFWGTKKHIPCKSGEITRIEHTEYSGEGLFYPDAVNGKCILFPKNNIENDIDDIIWNDIECDMEHNIIGNDIEHDTKHNIIGIDNDRINYLLSGNIEKKEE